MAVSQLIFFSGWLVAALAGGALLVFVWERAARQARASQPEKKMS